MPLVVTSAAGANGDGDGALLALDDDGKPERVNDFETADISI